MGKKHANSAWLKVQVRGAGGVHYHGYMLVALR